VQLFSFSSTQIMIFERDNNSL